VSGGKTEKDDIRLCMDMRWINKKSKPPEYIVPLTNDMFHRLKDFKYFTELDLSDAYHQIGLQEATKKICGFTAPNGKQYVWTRLFFGPRGAVGHFQRTLETAVKDFIEFVRTYMDNLLVHLMTLKTHVEEINAIIRELTRVGFRLKVTKCRLGYFRIYFMGSLVDGKTRSIDTHKVNVFEKLGRPKTGKDVESMLGFVNFLRDYVPMYSSITAPLEKLHKHRRISNRVWGAAEQRACSLRMCYEAGFGENRRRLCFVLFFFFFFFFLFSHCLLLLSCCL